MRTVARAARLPSLLIVALVAASCLQLPSLASRPTAAVASAPRSQTSASSDLASTSGTAPPTRPDGRLPELAIPVQYNLELQVDPRESDFTGTATILVDVRVPTRFLVLHALGLRLRSIGARFRGGWVVGESFSRNQTGKLPEVVLTFPQPLPQGRAVLEIAYEGPFQSYAWGLYRVNVSGRWYAFTNFEPMGARQMFPCFDEPGFKVPFNVAVTAPSGMLAFANMPEVARAPVERGARFTFATTPPLPTYLVAIAVGDLDVSVGANAPVPLRLLRAKGNTGDAGGVLRDAAGLTQILADYLDSPYPFPKLDLVAIPNFPGGMENAGLISFGASMLMLEQDPPPIWEQDMRVQLLAHELAHQWVGDLVTPLWWNDIWLSEGLATFMAARATDLWRPSWHAGAALVDSVEQAMRDDALPSATAVRRPIVSGNEAYQAAISKSNEVKAAGVLSMIERSIGSDPLRAGLRRFLRDHAWGSATTEDFVASLEAVSGRPLGSVVKSYLDRPGVPELDLTENCVSGRLTSVTVSQAPLASDGQSSNGSEENWVTPFCLKAPGSPNPICQTLIKRTTVAIPGAAPTCPVFLDPNPRLSGYYRYRVLPETFRVARLAAVDMGADAKIGLLSNAVASIRQRSLSPDALLSFLPTLDDEADGSVVLALTSTLEFIDTLVGDDDAARFGDYVLARLKRQKSRFGLDGAHGGSFGARGAAEVDYEFLRAKSAVAGMLGHYGDADVLNVAGAVAREFVDRASEPIDADLGPLAVRLAARSADSQTFEAFARQVERPSRPENRNIALSALGSMRNPDLVRRALEWTLSDRLSIDERSSLLRSLASERTTRQTVYDWIASRWYFLNDKWRGRAMWPAWNTIRFACDEHQREKLDALFKPAAVSRSEWFGTAAEWYGEQVDSAARCSALKEYAGKALGDYLRADARTK